VVEDQFRRLFDADGHRPGAASCRRAAATEHAGGRPEHQFLLAQPFLADTARALESRGAQLIRAFPFGAEGTTRWLQAAATGLGVDPRGSGHAGAAARARRSRRWPATRTRLAGQAHLLLPRFAARSAAGALPARELGMQLTEVGTPYLHRSTWRGTGAAARRHRCSAKARTSNASSTAAAPPRPTSWSAAWAWPTRWRPRA
jgi:light-independent protochlorophyllide reductase subunit N